MVEFLFEASYINWLYEVIETAREWICLVSEEICLSKHNRQVFKTILVFYIFSIYLCILWTSSIA